MLNQPRRGGGKKKVGFLGCSQQRKQNLASYILLKAGTGGWNRRPGQKKRKIYVLCKQKGRRKITNPTGQPYSEGDSCSYREGMVR